MRHAFSSAGSALVHLSALLLITLPSVPLLIALKIKRLRHRATSSRTRQLMASSQDLDDFHPDDWATQAWLDLLCDDPLAFSHTTDHLDRCYAANSATKPHS